MILHVFGMKIHVFKFSGIGDFFWLAYCWILGCFNNAFFLISFFLNALSVKDRLSRKATPCCKEKC